MCGAGDGDDETVSAELANIPSHYHALVFLVEISSLHTFTQVEAPTIRLVDSITDTELLNVPITDERAAGSNAFVFASIVRDESIEGGWRLNNISDHPDITQIQDWGQYLAQYAA